MTTLIVWAAIDLNVATAVYVASDSRLTWGDQGRWDLGPALCCGQLNAWE
jgi:hypothetical protein